MTARDTVVVPVAEVCIGIRYFAQDYGDEIVVDAVEAAGGGVVVLSMSPADEGLRVVQGAVFHAAETFRHEGLNVFVSSPRRKQLLARYAVAGVLFPEPSREWIA